MSLTCSLVSLTCLETNVLLARANTRYQVVSIHKIFYCFCILTQRIPGCIFTISILLCFVCYFWANSLSDGVCSV